MSAGIIDAYNPWFKQRCGLAQDFMCASQLGLGHTPGPILSFLMKALIPYKSFTLRIPFNFCYFLSSNTVTVGLYVCSRGTVSLGTSAAKAMTVSLLCCSGYSNEETITLDDYGTWPFYYIVWGKRVSSPVE